MLLLYMMSVINFIISPSENMIDIIMLFGLLGRYGKKRHVGAMIQLFLF